MRQGNAAGVLVGFPVRHLPFIQAVANRLDTVISFRAVGRACTQLIEEGYAMKGFRTGASETTPRATSLVSA